MNIYGVWHMMGRYEGADELLGLYSNVGKARKAMKDYLKERNYNVYITEIDVDNKAQWVWDAKSETHRKGKVVND